MTTIARAPGAPRALRLEARAEAQLTIARTPAAAERSRASPRVFRQTPRRFRRVRVDRARAVRLGPADARGVRARMRRRGLGRESEPPRGPTRSRRRSATWPLCCLYTLRAAALARPGPWRYIPQPVT